MRKFIIVLIVLLSVAANGSMIPASSIPASSIPASEPVITITIPITITIEEPAVPSPVVEPAPATTAAPPEGFDIYVCRTADYHNDRAHFSHCWDYKYPA